MSICPSAATRRKMTLFFLSIILSKKCTCLLHSRVLQESLLNCVLGVLEFMRADVLGVLVCLRACVLTCLAGSRAYAFTSFECLLALRSSHVLHGSCAHISYVLPCFFDNIKIQKFFHTKISCYSEKYLEPTWTSMTEFLPKKLTANSL